MCYRHDIPVRRKTAPAAVVAQAWRGGSGQARLTRFLVGSDIESLDDHHARQVGPLLAKASLADVVGGCVTEGALRRRDLVISSDPEDLRALAGAVNRRLEVEYP